MTAIKTFLLSKSALKVEWLVAKGFTSESIGKKLAITKSTVQTHRRNMFKKIGFNNTQQLGEWAVKGGLIQ